MYSLVYKRGADCIISTPDGLKELMADITREVLRAQPENIYLFIAQYLSAMLVTRDNCIMVTRLLADLCDCKFTVTERLLMLGYDDEKAAWAAGLIQESVESFNPLEEEVFKEKKVLKKLLPIRDLDVQEACKVCKVIREAYTEYWKKKKYMEHEELMEIVKEPWQIAAQKTIELYARTKPSMEEMQRAAVKIQKTYRGYYIRKCLLDLPCIEPSVEKLGSCKSSSSSAVEGEEEEKTKATSDLSLQLELSLPDHNESPRDDMEGYEGYDEMFIEGEGEESIVNNTDEEQINLTTYRVQLNRTPQIFERTALASVQEVDDTSEALEEKKRNIDNIPELELADTESAFSIDFDSDRTAKNDNAGKRGQNEADGYEADNISDTTGDYATTPTDELDNNSN